MNSIASLCQINPSASLHQLRDQRDAIVVAIGELLLAVHAADLAIAAAQQADNGRKAAVEAELADLLAPRIAAYAGDFDEWYRGEDPENVAYAKELIESLAGARVLNRAEIEGRLEKFWFDLRRDIAEEYAQAASWDRERGFARYENRRGV